LQNIDKRHSGTQPQARAEHRHLRTATVANSRGKWNVHA
jgi:hypothetical protein